MKKEDTITIDAFELLLMQYFSEKSKEIQKKLLDWNYRNPYHCFPSQYFNLFSLPDKQTKTKTPAKKCLV